MKIVGLIPARSGSKGLPDKNIKMMRGIPLLAHSIYAVLRSSVDELEEVYVSSDSDRYLEIADHYGAVPVKRSEHASTDTASIKDVILDTPQLFEADAVLLLYPIYPMRRAEDIDLYLRKFIEMEGKRSLIGAIPPKTHPYLCYQNIDSSPRHLFEDQIDNHLKYRRQDYPECWEITHWSCVFPVNLLSDLNEQLINQDTYFYKLPEPWKAADIDTQEQFNFVEQLMSRR